MEKEKYVLTMWVDDDINIDIKTMLMLSGNGRDLYLLLYLNPDSKYPFGIVELPEYVKKSDRKA